MLFWVRNKLLNFSPLSGFKAQRPSVGQSYTFRYVDAALELTPVDICSAETKAIVTVTGSKLRSYAKLD